MPESTPAFFYSSPNSHWSSPKSSKPPIISHPAILSNLKCAELSRMRKNTGQAGAIKVLA